MARQVIIGDIHACYDELRELLDLVGFRGDDELVAVGDLVNRGPDPESVLRFFRDQPQARTVQGNVEHGHADAARGQPPDAFAFMQTRAQLGDRYAKWVDFMHALPLYIELPEAIVVHGGVESGVPMDRQRTDVLLGLPSGEAHLAAACDGPWYDAYAGPKPLIVGHHDYQRNGQPLIREGKVYGIDTGCVYGGRLTALVLPDFQVASTPARADHWAQLRNAASPPPTDR